MAIRRMQGLVDDLLTYADLSRDDDWESVDLGVLCREVVEDFGDIIERTGAVVTIGDLPVITGTKINLRRLLLNLIGNSLKYVAPGVAPVVEITSQHANGMIEIAVSDNGIGIAAENFERIFDFFGRPASCGRVHGFRDGALHMPACRREHGRHHAGRFGARQGQYVYVQLSSLTGSKIMKRHLHHILLVDDNDDDNFFHQRSHSQDRLRRRYLGVPRRLRGDRTA